MIGQAERVAELNRLSAPESSGASPKIISFTSGKGGTGKTLLSLNIAYALSSAGVKVLFIDLDLNLSNAHIMLNEVAAKTLGGFFEGKCLLKELVIEYGENLHFIFGDSGSDNYSVNLSGNIQRFFAQLSRIAGDYDYILLDTGSGAGEGTMRILKNSDTAVFVITPEPTALMDAFVVMKLMKNSSFKVRKLAVVNKCGSDTEGKTAFGNLTAASSHFLQDNVELLGTVNFDGLVNKSIIAQKLLLQMYPDAEISLQINAVSQRIHEFMHLANIHQPTSSVHL